MEKINRNSNLRIIFSSIALGLFVLFILYDNFVVREFNTYHTYGGRLLFSATPFVALFAFSIMERKMRHINGRIFVIGIFVLYLVQALLFWFLDGIFEFSIFCCAFLGRLSEIVTAILIVRIVVLLLIPVAHKNMLRFYSLGMIAFMVFFLVAILTSDYTSMRYSTIETVVEICIDVLFHVGLFFFSDLLSEADKNFFDYIINGNKKSEGEDSMSICAEFFSEEALEKIDIFELRGDEFLLFPPDNALLCIELERQDEAVSVKGSFKYSFAKEQVLKILNKKSTLNITFQNISLDAESDVTIGVESIENGEFTITLASRTFSTKDKYTYVRNYILEFVNAIILIQNTESYK